MKDCKDKSLVIKVTRYERYKIKMEAYKSMMSMSDYMRIKLGLDTISSGADEINGNDFFTKEAIMELGGME